VLLVHNCFAAVQDVAIDALAVGTLRDEERGLANGLMFAGANVGQMIGGAGVLLLVKFVPSFNYTFFFVVGCLLAVTFGVALRIKEPPTPRAPVDPDGPQSTGARLAAELRRYVVTAFRSMLGGRVAVGALVLALLPAGPYALSLPLQSNLAVELGMSDDQVGYLSAASTVVAALGCVAGGWVSDRIGRRKALAGYVLLMAVPNVVLAAVMHRHGWVMPVDPRALDRPVPAHSLLVLFWWLTVVYQLFNGLMYGARSALYVDVSNPAVAATQFTAYMAMMNLVITYSALWQGNAVVKWGYPATLAIDAAFGLACLVALPLTYSRVPYARVAGGEERAVEATPAA
jgi:PAT family beta-lactamase induction signal transducer AmpG